jgi:hypothetical protein
MRSTKTLLVVAGLLAAGAVATAVSAERRMVSPSTTANEMLSSLDAATEREAAEGCVEDDGAGGKRFCKDSAKRARATHDDAVNAVDALTARPPEQRGGAIARIRAFRKHASLALQYRSTGPNPYADDATKRIETYVDDDDFEYWIDPANDALVQVGPRPDRHPATPKAGQDRLGVAELRAKAEAFVIREIPDFAERKPTLHPLEDNKNRLVYFFRWDDFSTPVKETGMPPFVQVALFADGSLASYTNTLVR